MIRKLQMKIKLLTKINACIALLLGALGITSCIGPKKYGAPEAMYGPPEDLYGVPYTELEDTIPAQPDNVIDLEEPQP